MASSETTPALSEATRFKTSLERLITWGIGLIVIAAAATTMWNKQQNEQAEQRKDVSVLASTVEDHAQQLRGIRAELQSVQINQAAQTEILKYLARDRRGPVPEAAK